MIFSTSESHFQALCWKIAFKQLQDAGVFVVTSISINVPHALEVSSKTLWMRRCNIHFNITSRVPRSYPKRLSVIFISEGSDLSYDPKSSLHVPQSPLKVTCPQVYPKRSSDIFNSEASDFSYVPKSPLNALQFPLKVPCPQVIP